ncbi:hypothetical protein OVA26_15930 [Microbacterium sp. SL62]|uniref:hypothetical protein n=1 Tax=Microbacterium sp. SL62 TaxID=2995139 RepID=UPI00227376A1|nr:hypothetical protein [Microbacterium sp. SL62]MCY1718424.1 hypothetical protein [Microbacterium sp. SL62]
MATKEESSERLRVSIPKVDQSSLDWWRTQHDVSLSVRMLIRAEIERNGYVDTAFQPVVQQPRRGRRPSDPIEESDEDAPTITSLAPPAPAPVIPATPPVLTPVPAISDTAPGFTIDNIMNG